MRAQHHATLTTQITHWWAIGQKFSLLKITCIIQLYTYHLALYENRKQNNKYNLDRIVIK